MVQRMGTLQPFLQNACKIEIVHSARQKPKPSKHKASNFREKCLDAQEAESFDL